jgi:hypothetical protein
MFLVRTGVQLQRNPARVKRARARKCFLREIRLITL